MAECRNRLTYSEFLEWVFYVQQEEGMWRLKQEYYWAQIAAKIIAVNIEHPGKVRTKDYLIQFIPQSTKDQMKQSKMVWAAALGVKLENN